ncbi:MAG: hypothetical protein U9R24_04685 [Thermodesulfobacteriota bacterium]|nr:hypothetical protein [Thermodesulfobacteriota bacterium]
MERPFLKTGFIGIAVILMSIVLMTVFPSHSPSMPKGFFTPIIAFEFIESPEEIYQLFGEKDSQEREDMVGAMDRGNRLDFIYMLLYSSFLFAFSIQCSKDRRQKIFYLGGFISVIILAGDFMENLQLLGITSKLPDGVFEGELLALKIFTWQKWGGIATIFLVLVPYFIRGNLFAKIIALWGIFVFFTGVMAYLHRSVLNEIFSLSVAIMFLLMIVYSFINKREFKNV